MASPGAKDPAYVGFAMLNPMVDPGEIAVDEKKLSTAASSASRHGSGGSPRMLTLVSSSTRKGPPPEGP
ncbi:MAG: hypothetical protein U0414_40770 [Polyangiaceae bacterium]